MKKQLFFKLFGIYFALNPFGNCFSPAVIFDVTNFKDGRSTWTLTFRPRRCLSETSFYWYGGLKFKWNCKWLARKFGTFIDTDFGGVSILDSKLLGYHCDL